MKRPDSRWFNPAAHQLFVMQARQQVPAKVATEFLELLNSGKVPNWVLGYIDLKVFRAAADG